MPHAKKGARTMRTRDDYQLFKVTYPYYDPDLIISIHLHFSPGDYLPPGRPLATLHFRPPPPTSDPPHPPPETLTQDLFTHMTGKMERAGAGFVRREGGWELGEGVRKGSLELAWMRQCEHIINKQSIIDSNTNITSKSQPLSCQICPRCQRQIWVYYTAQEEPVTTEALLSANHHMGLEHLDDLEWSIILNEQFTPKTVIGKANGHELNLPILGKATFLLGQGERAVDGVVMRVRQVICRHQKIYDRRCQYCLEVIDVHQMEDFTRYLFQLGPNGTWNSYAKGAALLHQEEQYITNILAKRRAILILDLDNTILHSNQMSEMELGDVLRLKEFFLLPKYQQSLEGRTKQDFIVVKMRPFLKEFLFIISRLFEVYVYTKGTRIYADGICRWVRAQWAGETPPYDINTWPEKSTNFLKNTECFSPHRVVSRNEDTSLETKSLQNILPNRTEYHLILDDRRDVWSNSPSWFYTREYYYFFKRQRGQGASRDVGGFIGEDKVNSVPAGGKIVDCYNHMRKDYSDKTEFQVDVSEKADYFLLFAANALKKIHGFFFDSIRKVKEDGIHSQKDKERERLQKQKAKDEKEKGKKPQKQKQKQKQPKKHHLISLSVLQQRIKMFFNKKKMRFFLVPGDESQSTVRRAMKMGVIVLKDTATDKPDYVMRGNNYMKFIKKWRQELKAKAQSTDKVSTNATEKDTKQEIKIQQKQPIQDEGMLQQTKKQVQKMQIQHPNIPEQQTITINTISESSPSTLPKPQQSKIQTTPKSIVIDYECEIKQLQQLFKSGAPVVAETWILACYQFSYKFRSEDFRLTDPFKEDMEHSDFDEAIARSAEKIRIEIEQDMKRELSSEAQGHKKKEHEKQEKLEKAEKSEKPKQQQKPQKKKQESKPKQEGPNLNKEMTIGAPKVQEKAKTYEKAKEGMEEGIHLG